MHAAVTLITCSLKGWCGTAELKGPLKVEVRNYMLINDYSMNPCSPVAQYKCPCLDEGLLFHPWFSFGNSRHKLGEIVLLLLTSVLCFSQGTMSSN